MSAPADIAVIGAGLVGAALAWGLARRGARVRLFDPEADELHASAGNFGLVWVQGKGVGAPDYAALTRRSAAAWPSFAQALAEAGGRGPAYLRCGGVKIALGEAELEAQAAALRRLRDQPPPGANDARMIDRAELRALLPEVGPEAAGGVFCPHDGHADPLATHAALKVAARRAGAEIVRARVEAARPDGAGFALETRGGAWRAARVVLAAGLGAPALAAALGLPAPVRPQRGQILVTERLPAFLPLATHLVRQTANGTVMLGDSKEEVGFDRGVTAAAGRAIAARAARLFPRLREARIVRQWGALRVLTPDGLPLYARSRAHPGAMLLTCHSGVTLAAAHVGEVADAVLEDRLAEAYPAFSGERLRRAA